MSSLRSRHSVEPLAFPSDAELTLPGSKSEANRLLVIAALSGAEVTVRGASPSDDVRHLVAGLTALGYAARFVDEADGVVRVGPRRADAPRSAELFCGNAGTALRFLVSVASVTPGEWTLTGDRHMQRRPIQPLVDAWRALGVDIDATHGCPPVRVRGGQPRGGTVRLDPSVSSQFLSSLLLVGSKLRSGLAVEFTAPLASRAYAELTCSLLARFSIDVELGADGARVAAGPGCAPAEATVGGDWSAMGVWIALNHLTGSRVRGHNLRERSDQADEGFGGLLATLGGPDPCTVDIEPMPDQFLNLAVLAAFRRGVTRITGAHNTRVKECDRVAVAAAQLRRLGADVDELDDGLLVRGGVPLHGGVIDPHDDHRVAMAFALAGCMVPGVQIEVPHCVAKSYPGFWQHLAEVRTRHRAVAIVGNRAAGKTTLARALAQHIGSEFADSDALFTSLHGPITAFVAEHGWSAFRREEERVVAQALRSGCILATGGGAVECGSTQALLRKRAFVIWLDAPVELLRQRLAGATERPSLSGRPLADEIGDLAEARNPVYARLCNRRIDASLPVAGQVETALRAEVR